MGHASPEIPASLAPNMDWLDARALVLAMFDQNPLSTMPLVDAAPGSVLPFQLWEECSGILRVL